MKLRKTVVKTFLNLKTTVYSVLINFYIIPLFCLYTASLYTSFEFWFLYHIFFEKVLFDFRFGFLDFKLPKSFHIQKNVYYIIYIQIDTNTTKSKDILSQRLIERT